MENAFDILLSMKMQHGWVEYGRFHIGNDPHLAMEIFHELEGELTEGLLIRLDLMEMGEPEQLLINSTYCTLPQLAENIKIITREFFKRINL